MKASAIKSSYGILDVTKGRKKLTKALAANGPLPVVIHAVLTDPFGGDDGTSIEFNMQVISVSPTPSRE